MKATIKEAKSIGTHETPDNVKDVLKRIADIKKMSVQLRQGNKPPESANDIYLYELFKPDLTHKIHILLHGKCFKDAMKPYTDWGYTYIQSTHFSHTEKTYARVKCEFCKECLNPPLAAQLTAEKLEKQQKMAKSYAAWVKKQILLGKM